VTLHNISGVILVHHDGTWNVVEEPFDANYDVDDFNSKELRNLTTAWKIGRVDVDGAATKSFATVGDSTKRLNVISVTPSNERDVALAKLDSPTAFPTVDLAQGDTNPKEGSDITVLGFPANALSSEDVPIGGNTDSDTTRTYQVILGDGKIGAVSKPTEIKSHSMHESDFQDSYQLTMTSMGHGASGSPVFDTATGTVIGILAFGTVTPGDPMAIYAIPIKYGLKLLKP
jgi:hypothetical protein